MFIITDTYNGGEHLPTLKDTLKEASDFVLQEMAKYIRDIFNKKDIFSNIDLYKMTDEEVIEWAKKAVGLVISDYGAEICYGDGDSLYNMMSVYNLDDLR